MTAEVIAIPCVRKVTVPWLRRHEREAHLREMAWHVTVGTPPPDFMIRVAVTALAHESLRGLRAMQAWHKFIGEERRVLAVEAGDPYWDDLQPGLAEADRDNALRVLLDGSKTRGGLT